MKEVFSLHQQRAASTANLNKGRSIMGQMINNIMKISTALIPVQQQGHAIFTTLLLNNKKGKSENADISLKYRK